MHSVYTQLMSSTQPFLLFLNTDLSNQKPEYRHFISICRPGISGELIHTKLNSHILLSMWYYMTRLRFYFNQIACAPLCSVAESWWLINFLLFSYGLGSLSESFFPCLGSKGGERRRKEGGQQIALLMYIWWLHGPVLHTLTGYQVDAELSQ